MKRDSITLGLNWYFNPYAKLMFNWVHFSGDNTPLDPLGTKTEGRRASPRVSTSTSERGDGDGPRRHRAFAAAGVRAVASGITIFWLSLIVLVPLSAVFVQQLSRADGTHSARGGASAARHRFLPADVRRGGCWRRRSTCCSACSRLGPGALRLSRASGCSSALIDLPFALPTAVAGIALTALYADTGLLGAQLAPLGLPVAYKPAGVVLALIFIGLPFVVRTVEPVLAELRSEIEEAARHARRANRLADLRAGDPADDRAGARDRLRARLRAGRRRIWLGHLHRRQHAVRVRNLAAADRHPARGI